MTTSKELLWLRPDSRVAECLWYYSNATSCGYRTVHLWGEAVDALDSAMGFTWGVRRCIVCGTIDTAYLEAQWDQKDQW